MTDERQYADEQLLGDVSQHHRERIENLRIYYPFFKLMELNTAAAFGPAYETLDMGYLVMAVLRFMIEYNHFRDTAVTYEAYQQFMETLIRRDFGLEPTQELLLSVFNRICNEGRPFEFSFFDPAAGRRQRVRVRLIESETDRMQVRYRISPEAVAFYLDTREMQEESRVSTEQLLLQKMISSGRYQEGLDVVTRINMEVGALLQEQREIARLMQTDIHAGFARSDAWQKRIFAWFDEEQALFESNLALSSRALKKLGGGQALPETVQTVYALDQSLKKALAGHSQLMQLCLQMQSAGDEALRSARRARFRDTVDLKDLGRRIMAGGDASQMAALVLPLFAPRLKKTFPLSRVDELLQLVPEETEPAEKIRHERERDYVYEDEAAAARVHDNFALLLGVLLEQLAGLEPRGTLTLEDFVRACRLRMSEKVLSNADFYAFAVHLCRKDSYDLSFPGDRQETFLEKEMADYLRQGHDAYKKLRFRLHFQPEQELTLKDADRMSGVLIERE